jgi:hypothetical protein
MPSRRFLAADLLRDVPPGTFRDEFFTRVERQVAREIETVLRRHKCHLNIVLMERDANGIGRRIRCPRCNTDDRVAFSMPPSMWPPTYRRWGPVTSFEPDPEPPER